MKTKLTHYISRNVTKATCLIGLAVGFNTNLAAQTLRPTNILNTKNLIEEVAATRAVNKTSNENSTTWGRVANLKSIPGKSKDYDYNTADSVWYHLSNTIYTANSRGQLLTATSQSSDSTTNHSRLIMGYDAYGNDTLRLFQSWNDTAWTTNNGDKTTITYNAKGQVISRVFYDYYSNRWNIEDKDSTVYDLEGRLSEEIFIEWIDSSWSIQSRTLYLYNPGSTVCHEALFQDYNNGTWIDRARANEIVWYNFDAKLITSYVYQTKVSEIWTDNASINVSWDDNGSNIMTYRVWNNGQWENILRASNLYDDMKNPTATINEQWNGVDWEIYYANAYDNKYNNNDLVESIQKNYNTSDKSYSYIYKQEFSDFTYVTATPKASALEVKLYPNPAADFVTLEAAITGNATLKVTDLAGRTVINQPVQQLANQKVDLSALNAGIYVLTVDAKEGRFVAKVVKQ